MSAVAIDSEPTMVTAMIRQNRISEIRSIGSSNCSRSSFAMPVTERSGLFTVDFLVTLNAIATNKRI